MFSPVARRKTYWKSRLRKFRQRSASRSLESRNSQEIGSTPSQVALSWVLHSPLNVFALIGPANVSELDDCLGALDVELTADEVAWLNLETMSSSVMQHAPRL